MSEQPVLSPVFDPLAPIDIVLSGRDFERTLVQDGQHQMQITKAAIVPNKANDNRNIHVCATTVNPTPTNKPGVVLQPGDREFQVWQGIFATEKQKEKGVDPLGQIADMFAAVFNCPLAECPNINNDTVNMMVGKRFTGIVRYEDDPQFGKQDRLVKFLPAQG